MVVSAANSTAIHSAAAWVNRHTEIQLSENRNFSLNWNVLLRCVLVGLMNKRSGEDITTFWSGCDNSN